MGPVRQAAGGLQRLFPLRYSGTQLSRSDRELARSLGVTDADSRALALGIERVLRRDRSAVRSAISALERMRDVAADRLMFEYAAALREQVRGLRWITEPQKLGAIGAVDADHEAVATSGSITLRVVLALRGGRLRQRHVQPVASIDGGSGATPDGEWGDLARRNAELIARLAAAEALGPLGWRR